MTQKIEILQKLQTLLNIAFNKRIQNVVLFGSQSKYTENESSDYDFLIVTKDIFNWQEKNAIRDICFDISLEYEILIDSKIISQVEIDSRFWGKHPLISDAINFGIHAR